MSSKILSTLIIYHLVHHTPKCVSSDTNLSGSLNNNPNETSSSKHKNPPNTIASVVTSPSTPAAEAGTPTTPSTPASGQSSRPADTSEPGKPKPIQLDIKSKSNCDEYEYIKKEITNVATFEAKKGYEFNSVKQKTNVIWQTDKESEYCTKVVVDGVGSGKKKVFIYFKNESYKRFWKMNRKWEEIVILPENDSLLIKVITLDPSDNKKTKENDTSQYNYNRENSDRENYIFNNDAKCIELKIGDKTVWAHYENKTHGYPKSILVWKKQSILVMFEKGVVKCNKEDNEWKVKEDFGGMYVAVSQPTECKSREGEEKQKIDEDDSSTEFSDPNQGEEDGSASEDFKSTSTPVTPTSVSETGTSTEGVPESGSGTGIGSDVPTSEGPTPTDTPSTPTAKEEATPSGTSNNTVEVTEGPNESGYGDKAEADNTPAADQEPSVPVTPTTLVELDVAHRSSCDQYEYEKKDKVQTYTAKPGYEFNKVVNGTDVLWNPEDNNNNQNATIETDEYGNKYIKIVLRNT